MEAVSEGENGLSYTNEFQWVLGGFLVVWKGSGLSIPAQAAQCERSSSEQWVSVHRLLWLGILDLLSAVLVQFVIEISLGLKHVSLLLLNQIGFQEPISA